MLYQADYTYLSELFIVNPCLRGTGTLGGMRLAHVPGRGVDRHCVCERERERSLRNRLWPGTLRQQPWLLGRRDGLLH